MKTEPITPRWRGVRAAGVVRRARPRLMLLIAGAVAGCQTYEARPLDVAGTREAWMARSPEVPSVRSLADALAAREGQEGGFDLSDGLSLREGEAVALVFNPDVRVARLRARVSAASAEHAGLWDDPVLGFDFERIVSGVGGQNAWVAGGTLGLTIPISGRLEAEKARAGAEASAELERVAALEWTTRCRLREAWIAWSAARLRAEIGAGYVGRLREVTALAESQGRAGSITLAEARVFRVELAGREAEQIGLESRRAEWEGSVRAIMGLSPGSGVVLSPSLAAEVREPAGDLAGGLGDMELNSPELAAARAEYEVAERALRLEIRRQFPDLEIGPGYASDQGDDRVLLGVSVPLPLWNRNRQAIARAGAERDAARGAFEATYERLASSLSGALARLESARREREAVEGVLAPLADEQEAEVRRIAGLGRLEPLLLLEALQSQQAARERLIVARESEAMAAARVRELLGPWVMVEGMTGAGWADSGSGPEAGAESGGGAGGGNHP